MIKFWDNFLGSAIKDDGPSKVLYTTILTGIIPLRIDSLSSDFDELSEDSLATTQLPEYYGFTEAEVSELFKENA